MTSSTVLRHPVDLIATIPYQLGFHPDASLVVVYLHRGRVGAVQRIDLPEPGSPEGGRVGSAPAVALLVRQRPDAVILVGYEDQAHSSARLRSWLRYRCRDLGIAVSSELVVTDGRWRVAGPQQEQGSDWQEVPAAGDVAAVAEWVGLGIVPWPDRESLVRSLRPGRESVPLRSVLSRCPAPKPPVGTDRAITAWSQVLDPVGVGAPVAQLPVPVLLDAVRGLLDRTLRDAVIGWAAPGALPDRAVTSASRALNQVLGAPPGRGGPHEQSERYRYQDRLAQFVRCVPVPRQAPALTVLGCVAWWNGNGGLAREAVARACRIEPGYTLAGLLNRIIDAGIRW